MGNRDDGIKLPVSDRWLRRAFQRSGPGCLTEALEPALKYVTEWQLAVDVGAHVGTWSRVLTGRFGAVLAIEPEPDNFECLKENAPNAIHLNMAVGPFPRGRIEIDKDRSTNSGARYVVPCDDVRGVTMVRLDDLTGETLNCGLIKIDVEGAEISVLETATETLRRCRPVVVAEIKDDMARRFGHEPDDLTAFMAGVGARVALVVRNDYIFVFPK